MTMKDDPRNPGSLTPAPPPAAPPTPGDPRAGTHTDREPDLHADLESIRAAWSVLQREQPPDLLDQAVLNAARRAVKVPMGKPGGRPSGWPFRWPMRWPMRWSMRWPMRWMAAFATAAVVVLAATIVLEQGREAPGPLPPTGNGYELGHPAAPAVIGVEADHDAKPAESREKLDPQQPLRDRAEPAMELSKRMAAPTDAAAATPPQAPAEPASTDSPPSAEAWIERLRDLKARGELHAFEKQLAAFRAAYPDYPLPPELLQ